ncbi:hypothetical protein CFI11_21385 [Thalassococcus sp. S3]|nr:hypothetical protein CFI11_21385 [Thalassococcus sp. S3]
MPHIAIIILGSLALAGCSNTGLRDLRSNSGGPDEFLVQPVKPLSAPDSYSALPTPMPGGANLVDPQPRADAVVALGGRASALSSQGVPASDAALVGQTGRYGVQSGIRASLAEEDEAFRRRRGRLTQFQLFRTDRYNQVYRRQSLDPFDETDRFRRTGAQTSTSPPQEN